jgi:hypothetical protein
VFTVNIYYGRIISRGLGRHQRALLETDDVRGDAAAIRRDVDAGPDAEPCSSFERSVRRSLYRMVSDGFLIALVHHDWPSVVGSDHQCCHQQRK